MAKELQGKFNVTVIEAGNSFHPLTTDLSRVEKGIRLLLGLTREYACLIVKSCAARAGLDPLINPETGKVRGISRSRWQFQQLSNQ